MAVTQDAEAPETGPSLEDPQVRKILLVAMDIARGLFAVGGRYHLTLGELVEVCGLAQVHLLTAMLVQNAPTAQWSLADRKALVVLAEDVSGRLHLQIKDLQTRLDIGGTQYLNQLQAEQQNLRRALQPLIVPPAGGKVS